METAMPPQTIESRVERLEQRVTALEQLPSRIDGLATQISQLRDEMHGGFSAMQTRVESGEGETRRTLREEIQAVGTQMRVLHEDVISRLQLIQEGQPRRRKRRS
jgi:hypothetical protein